VAADILPDSRTRSGAGSIPSKLGNLIPIYCANCGDFYGHVPEKMITFAFALCNDCEKLGDIAHMYKEPDAVFWARVEEAQREEHGRVLSAQELLVQLDDPTTTLAKLKEEWLTHVRKTI
jgi:hypothetical protein